MTKFGRLGSNSGLSSNSNNQVASSEELNSVQNRITNARALINSNQVNAISAHEDDHNHAAELALFKNAINDPRFAKINQVPQGISDRDLLRLFPNIRSVLERDPSKEATFITNLNALSNSLQVKESQSSLNKNDTESMLNSKSSTANTATKKMIAASFLNMVGNNQSVVNGLIERGPNVYLGDISRSGAGGWFTTENNMVLPKLGSRIGSETVDLASFAKVATHELGHWIDFADGNIDGRSSLLGAQFNSIRNSVYQGISSGIYDHLHNYYEDYAMNNPQEFFAVMGQFYANNPIAMQDDMPEMYRLFANAFNMDSTGRLALNDNAQIAQNSNSNNSSSTRSTTRNAQNTNTTQTNTRRTIANDRRYGNRTLVNNNQNAPRNAMSPIARNRLA